MPQGHGDQLHPAQRSPVRNLCHYFLISTIQLLGSAELLPLLVNFADKLSRGLLAQVFGQMAAHLSSDS